MNHASIWYFRLNLFSIRLSCTLVNLERLLRHYFQLFSFLSAKRQRHRYSNWSHLVISTIQLLSFSIVPRQKKNPALLDRCHSRRSEAVDNLREHFLRQKTAELSKNWRVFLILIHRIKAWKNLCEAYDMVQMKFSRAIHIIFFFNTRQLYFQKF